MTDDEIREKYKDVPSSQLIKRLFVLLFKLIIVCIQHFLALIIHGIVWCCHRCKQGLVALKVFWNSSNTIDKRRKIAEAIKNGFRTFIKSCIITWKAIKKYTIIGAKATWKYTCKACRLFVKYFLLTMIAIWHAIIWSIHTTKDLIVHSKPTFIRLGHNIKQGTIDFWHLLKRTGRGIKLRRIRRKRAWLHFRRTKGFKGLLIDMGHGLSYGIQSYMNEEQTDAHPEAITEDDIIAEEMEERQGKANKLGQKLFKGMKDIVEEK